MAIFELDPIIRSAGAEFSDDTDTSAILCRCFVVGARRLAESLGFRPGFFAWLFSARGFFRFAMAKVDPNVGR